MHFVHTKQKSYELSTPTPLCRNNINGFGFVFLEPFNFEVNSRKDGETSNYNPLDIYSKLRLISNEVSKSLNHSRSVQDAFLILPMQF